MTHSEDAHRPTVVRASIGALILLALSLCGAPAASEQTPAAPPSPEKIAALIAELHPEYALPPTAWGGAVTSDSLQMLQAVRQGAERSASRTAARELVKIGKPAVPLLVAALKTAEGRKAEAIAEVLAGIGGRETLYPLLCLADDPRQVLRARLAAAIAAAQSDQGQWPLLLASLWLSGEGILLADAISSSKLVTGEPDRVRLQWFRQSQEEMFLAARNATRALAPLARAASVPPTDIWGTILAWDKWWVRAHPFRTVEVLVDDPWQNRTWCQRTLGTLAEYGPMIVEMRRIFIEARLRAWAAEPSPSVGALLCELRSMTYAAEPFPLASSQAARFSLSGYVRSGMLIYDYGYDRSRGAWSLLNRMYVGVDGQALSDAPNSHEPLPREIKKELNRKEPNP